MNFIKQHVWLIVLCIVIILFDLYSKQVFFTALLSYGLFIKFLLSKFVTERLRKILAITIWSAFLLTTFLLYYVHHNLPQGPMFDTGDVVCQNDDRGPCAEQFIEDPRYLPIPEWAKFLKRSEGMALWMGLLFAGIVVSKKQGEE